MPRKGVTIYDLLISCPGDVSDEIEIIQKTIENFNRMFGSAYNIEINLKHWSTDAFPQSGGKPQDLLNDQFINECDAAIAVFWTRFGTPTDEYQSGTEEEIEEMIKSGKQVFLYFSDKPASPSQINQEQYKKVSEFKDKYKDKGLYWTFSNTEEFEKLLLNHITLYFLKVGSENDNVPTTSLTSQLVVRGLLNHTISEKLYIGNRNWLNSKLILEKEDSIKRSYEEISSMVIPTKLIEEYQNTAPVDHNGVNPIAELQTTINKNFSIFKPQFKNVTLSEILEKTISEYAIDRGIPVTENFFNIGNLKESISQIGVNLLGYSEPSYEGTEEEKGKYNALIKLYFDIIEYNQYVEYFSQLSNKGIGVCVVSNIGKSYDEDIDIKLIIPKNTICKAKDFILPGSEIIEFICQKEVFSFIFTMSDEAYVEKFSNYPVTKFLPNSYISNNPLMGKIAKEELKSEYLDKLNQVFCYRYFENDDCDILTFNIPYLKQNTNMGIPSLLYFKNIPDYIKYEIRSKLFPEVVTGKLEIEKH